MPRRFIKLNRAAMKNLTPGQEIMENGIRYTKLKDGDGRFSVDIMVDGRRVHKTVGLESEGVTRQQAEEYIEQVKTDARHQRLNLPTGRKASLLFKPAAYQYLERLTLEDGKDLKKKSVGLSCICCLSLVNSN